MPTLIQLYIISTQVAAQALTKVCDDLEKGQVNINFYWGKHENGTKNHNPASTRGMIFWPVQIFSFGFIAH